MTTSPATSAASAGERFFIGIGTFVQRRYPSNPCEPDLVILRDSDNDVMVLNRREATILKRWLEQQGF